MHRPTMLLSLLFACGLASQEPTIATAQTAPRIGVFFWHDSPNDLTTFAGIKTGLRQAGLRPTYLEHRADSDRERAARELAALRAARCDLVFAMGTQSALLAKEALSKVPIVFAAVSNPVASGVVPAWSGSDRSNLCGASNWIAPRTVLDVFGLAVPDLRRLGILRSADAGVVSQAELTTMRALLQEDKSLRVELFEAVATDRTDIPRALGQLLRHDLDALWIPIDLTIYRNLPAVQQALGERQLPLLTTAAAAVHAGALVAAVADYELHGRRAAALATRILRSGEIPGSLAIDRMRGSLVVANLGTAQQAGLELPLSLLVLADELIAPEARYVGK